MDFDQQLVLARQKIHAGDLTGAEALCRHVLAQRPDNFDAACLAGIVCLQQDRLPDAAELLSRAARTRPDVADVHANLGHALRGLGRFEEAAASLERAVQLRPNYPIAMNNLGLVRRAQGRIADAVACYQRAIGLQPNFLHAHMNLGNALLDAGRPADAARTFRAAMGLAPHNPDAQAGLAAALEAAGDAPAALVNYEAVLRRQPNHVTTLVNLASLLKKQNRLDDSLALLRRALGASPNSPDAHERLGRGLWDAGAYEDGLAHFAEAIRIRPSPVARVSAATLVPPIYRSLEEVQAWRDRLLTEVAKLRGDGVTIDLTNHVARAPFYLPYAGLNDRDVMRDIAALHRPPPDVPLPPRTGGKIRVGFISTLLKDHTIGLWNQGLIDQLPRDRFEVTVISVGRHDDAVARVIRSRADRFVELAPSLPAARQAILSLNLDALLYTDLGMEGFCWSLAFSRLARVQCAMWGHPETSGIHAVDYYLSSELTESPKAEGDYTEKLVRLNNLPLYYFRPPPAPPRDRAYFNLPPRGQGNVYGCLQATFKLHPSFDVVLGEVLRRDPQGIVLVPRTGASNWDRMVIDRIGRTCGDVVSRIRFIGRVSREDFAALGVACDATLAPFPFGAGDTSLVAFAEGVPVVTMPTPHLRGRFTHGMYRATGIDDCVAATPERYVEIALRLANDPAWREQIGARIRERNHVLFENIAGVNELAEWLGDITSRPAPA
jgi:predicted O-linked N-acetylglucosamine transferase (SPINDLY family)